MLVLEEKEENLIKKVCKDLNLTYKKLADEIGYTEGNLKNSVFKNQISKPLERAIELYLETQKLKKEIAKNKELKQVLKTLINE
ncbi:MAG: Unknown protein [uncultured Sulfurovum sp.]|uniref:Uncharacterized protein n=1 Tax=uncultured Sulfurovum sp. TaxID=269237 RepID=A0A6S6TSE4_9BACT|nr:MAG: Unknown protein [uncultured Sulfurovum sp.]